MEEGRRAPASCCKARPAACQLDATALLAGIEHRLVFMGMNLNF